MIFTKLFVLLSFKHICATQCERARSLSLNSSPQSLGGEQICSPLQNGVKSCSIQALQTSRED